jgi:uroporphyrinogen decarboxylase
VEKIEKPLLRVLKGEQVWPLPIWMMRQAGRYLPEYRALRATTSSFLDFCYHPEKAAEATLQPIKRFNFDAAIIFSDILVVPHALGQSVNFVEGEGPKLDPIRSMTDFKKLDEDLSLARLEPVFEALQRVKGALPSHTTLIGFCGAPWTVASYMIAGKSTPDQAAARLLAYQDPALMDALIERLVQASIAYLIRQVDAGAECVQIFESFGAALTPDLFQHLSLKPIAAILRGLKAVHPQAKAILFVRGGGAYLKALADLGLADCLALDWSFDMQNLAHHFSIATQGNLDPQVLVAGGASLTRAIDQILPYVKNRPHIFNLGHGIVPQTPIAHVEAMIHHVRNTAL